MIIQSVVADNLFKYCQIRLTELPENGIIAMSGDSQARESVIESVCFALFGRGCTQNILYEGANDGFINLQFSLDDGTQYELTRRLNSDGIQRISLQKKSGESEAALVDQATVDRVIGFTYEMFVEYLLWVNSGEQPLSKLKEHRDHVARQLKKRQDLHASLNYRTTLFQGSQRTIRKAKRGLKQSNFFQGVMFLYTLYLIVAALANTMMPESALAKVLLGQLMAQYPGWDSTDLSPLLYSIIGLCLLLSVTWGLCLILKMRIKGLQQVPKKMAEALATLDELADGAPVERMAERDILRGKLLDKTAQPEEIQDYLKRIKPWIDQSLDRFRTQLLLAERAVSSALVDINGRATDVEKWLSECSIVKQFIFLNDYCADDSFNKLITSNKALSQLWFFSDSVPKVHEITLHIRCENKRGELKVSG